MIKFTAHDTRLNTKLFEEETNDGVEEDPHFAVELCNRICDRSGETCGWASLANGAILGLKAIWPNSDLLTKAADQSYEFAITSCEATAIICAACHLLEEFLETLDSDDAPAIGLARGESLTADTSDNFDGRVDQVGNTPLE